MAKTKKPQPERFVRAYEVKRDGKTKLVPDARRMVNIVRSLEEGESIKVTVRGLAESEWIALL